MEGHIVMFSFSIVHKHITVLWYGGPWTRHGSRRQGGGHPVGVGGEHRGPECGGGGTGHPRDGGEWSERGQRGGQ